MIVICGEMVATLATINVTKADQFAAENEKRYTHEEVFANLRRKING